MPNYSMPSPSNWLLQRLLPPSSWTWQPWSPVLNTHEAPPFHWHPLPVITLPRLDWHGWVLPPVLPIVVAAVFVFCVLFPWLPLLLHLRQFHLLATTSRMIPKLSTPKIQHVPISAWPSKHGIGHEHRRTRGGRLRDCTPNRNFGACHSCQWRMICLFRTMRAAAAKCRPLPTTISPHHQHQQHHHQQQQNLIRSQECNLPFDWPVH
mmetsp:Transcript_3725/g.8289  ORF Transcript_3725/g.8289 Transcript_3725/m.8289 type:complete len:207 (-) Transcript_3725:764-1384(-)